VTVRALVVGDKGWEWAAVAEPEPAPHEVVVEVRAMSLNRADLDEVRGGYLPRDRGAGQRIAGSDLAGVVRTEGAGFAEGDRVMAMTEGAFAERIAVDDRLLLPVPPDLDWISAAALPSALLTEYDALVLQGGFRAGQSVLVTAAASGVGMFGARLAHWLGASAVFGTTTSPAKADVLRECGVRPVSRMTEILDATGGRGVDVVLDHVGGPLLDEVLAATRIGGTVLQIGRLGGVRAPVDLDLLAYRRIRLLGTTFRTRDDDLRAGIVREVAGILPVLPVRARVARVLPFEDAVHALTDLDSPDTVGKIVLTRA
jgi:NADPH2:quinone reductase